MIFLCYCTQFSLCIVFLNCKFRGPWLFQLGSDQMSTEANSSLDHPSTLNSLSNIWCSWRLGVEHCLASLSLTFRMKLASSGTTVWGRWPAETGSCLEFIFNPSSTWNGPARPLQIIPVHLITPPPSPHTHTVLNWCAVSIQPRAHQSRVTVISFVYKGSEKSVFTQCLASSWCFLLCYLCFWTFLTLSAMRSPLYFCRIQRCCSSGRWQHFPGKFHWSSQGIFLSVQGCFCIPVDSQICCLCNDHNSNLNAYHLSHSLSQWITWKCLRWVNNDVKSVFLEKPLVHWYYKVLQLIHCYPFKAICIFICIISHWNIGAHKT